MSRIDEKITPFLWFDDQADQAANFYVSLFDDSEILDVSRYPEGVPGRNAGDAMTVEFRLAGRRFTALNGGPEFRFNEAISLQILCDSQKEIDYYWERLAQGGDPAAQQCGWLKDKFGVSWQVTPRKLADMMADEDSEKASRVMEVLLPMKKLDVASLERAYKGVGVGV